MKRLIVLVALFAAGCGTAKSSPMSIEADGEYFVACKDTVWVDTDGGGTLFRVKFTDSNGDSNVIQGIKKLRLISLSTPPPVCLSAR